MIVEKTISTFGKVDILVNNAGIIRRTPAIDFSEKDWDEVMTLNAKTVFFFSQAVARDMMKRKEGKIINVPIGIFNHAMDAVRYGMESLRPQNPEVVARAKIRNTRQSTAWSIG